VPTDPVEPRMTTSRRSLIGPCSQQLPATSAFAHAGAEADLRWFGVNSAKGQGRWAYPRSGRGSGLPRCAMPSPPPSCSSRSSPTSTVLRSPRSSRAAPMRSATG
jgi:hypothetical protein